MDDRKNYSDVLLEDINSKFDAIMEVVGSMQDKVKRIPKMAERIEKLEDDISTIKLVTMSTQSDTSLIKIRTEKLEAVQDKLDDLESRLKVLETSS